MASPNAKFQIHNNQDYAKIREECLKFRRLWEDTSYIATFEDRSDCDLKRPGDIVTKPRFIKAGSREVPSRFNLHNIDLCRSMDESVIMLNLATLSALTLHPKIFRFVVPDDNAEFFDENYVGLFHFKFWRYGKFYDVVVDDRLPTRDGKLVSILKDGQPDEFWPFLLVKAYIKLCGPAESLNKAKVQDFLVDLTSGVPELHVSLGHTNPASKPNLDRILYESYERGSIIIFGRHWHNSFKNMDMRNIYCITKAIYLDNDRSGQTLLLRIFMPFETKEEEWKGPWREESDEWKSVPEAKKEGLGVVEKYESWILFSEFNKHDWDIYISHLNPLYIENWESDQDSGLRWCSTFLEGKWVKGVSSGGSRRDHLDTFHLNPQFHISLKLPAVVGSSDFTIIVSLLQKTHKSDRLAMDIYIFKLKQEPLERLDKEFFIHNNPIVDRSSLLEEREVSRRFRISSGEYCIVVATNKPDKEASFLLRLLTEHSVTMTVLNEKVVKKDTDVRVSITPPLSEEELHEVQEFNKNVRDFFESVSGEDKVVGWKGLQKVLNFAMDSERPKSGSYVVRNSLFSYILPSNSVFDTMEDREFSKDLSRSLLATADLDQSGKLTFHEFQGLWSQIRQWKEVYEMHSGDNGYLPKENFRGALDSAGFQLTSEMLSNLAIRYSNRDGVIPFDDFLMCTAKLRTVFDYFMSKDPEKTDKAAFSVDEWLQKSIYS